jgi:hypothetical protein
VQSQALLSSQLTWRRNNKLNFIVGVAGASVHVHCSSQTNWSGAKNADDAMNALKVQQPVGRLPKPVRGVEKRCLQTASLLTSASKERLCATTVHVEQHLRVTIRWCPWPWDRATDPASSVALSFSHVRHHSFAVQEENSMFLSKIISSCLQKH